MTDKRVKLRKSILKKSKSILDSNPEISLNQLLKQVGVSKSSFYNLFRNKSDLFIQIYAIPEGELTSYYDSIKEILSPSEQISAIFEYQYKRFSKINRFFVITMLNEESVNVSSIGEFFSFEIFSVLRSIIDEGIRLGIYDKNNDIELMLRSIAYTALGVIHSWAFMKGEYDIVGEIDEVVSIWIKALI